MDKTRFVRASSLSLRSKPSVNAKKLESLPLNTEVVIDETASKEGWVRVLAPSGARGWVSAVLLAESTLSLEEAMQAADQASGKELLTWLERMHTLQPEDRGVMARLSRAYAEAGMVAEAEYIGRKMVALEIRGHSWFLARPSYRDPLRVDLGEQQDLTRDYELTRWQLEELGFGKNDVWWVLPASGQAVKATSWKVRHEHDGCIFRSGYVLLLNAPLPEGDVAIAVSRSPPASWSKALNPGLSEDAARAVIAEYQKSTGRPTATFVSS